MYYTLLTIFAIILFNAHQSYDVECLVTVLVTKRCNYCATVKKSFKIAETDSKRFKTFSRSPSKVEDFSGTNCNAIYHSPRLPYALDVGCLMVRPQKTMKTSYKDLR